jgi:hypothetical protein
MTTYGSHEEPSADESGDPSGEAQARAAGAAGLGGTEPGEYSGEGSPPPVYATGRHQVDDAPITHPPDPILPFISPPVARRRRRDWPVLVVALIIAAIVMAACCIAGFALYSSKGPTFR